MALAESASTCGSRAPSVTLDLEFFEIAASLADTERSLRKAHDAFDFATVVLDQACGNYSQILLGKASVTDEEALWHCMGIYNSLIKYELATMDVHVAAYQCLRAEQNMAAFRHPNCLIKTVGYSLEELNHLENIFDIEMQATRNHIHKKAEVLVEYMEMLDQDPSLRGHTRKRDTERGFCRAFSMPVGYR